MILFAETFLRRRPVLVKLFGLGKVIEPGKLSDSITEALTRLGFEGETVTVRYSPIPVTSGSGRVTVLVTGSDALGWERRIISAVGKACDEYYSKHGLEFPGVSNPALPNQK